MGIFELLRKMKETSEYMEKLRFAVNRYKPLIEQRTGEDLGEMKVEVLYNADECVVLGHRNSCIYVPFRRRKDPILGDLLEKEPDGPVVHELGHCLWDKKITGKHIEFLLGKISLKELKAIYKSWSEGFATYCQHDMFADFYPQGFSQYGPYTMPNEYYVGWRKVDWVEREFGKDVVLDIPQKWQEFELELKKWFSSPFKQRRS